MKLVTLALIAVCAVTAAAQSSTHTEEIPGLLTVPPGMSLDNMNLQIGCPVAFTEVALQHNARYMPVKQNTAWDSSLAFRYKNQSGKLIESIEIRVELKVKKSVYDLDATTITRDVTLTGDTSDTLPLNVIAYSVGRVTLAQVNYTGGKVWTPKARNTCNYESPNTSEQIGKLQ